MTEKEIEKKLEDYLLNLIKEPEYINNIELVNAYALVRIANELENIRGILWDIKTLLVKG